MGILSLNGGNGRTTSAGDANAIYSPLADVLMLMVMLMAACDAALHCNE